MSVLPHILILSESNSEALQLQKQITELNYVSVIKEKKSNFLDLLHDNLLVLLKPGKALEQDLKILKQLKDKIPFLPVMSLTSANDELHFKLAQGTNALMKIPISSEALKKKLLRYTDPQATHDCRVYERKDAKMSIEWSYLESGDKRKTTTANISSGGVFVIESQLLPKRGDVLNFLLQDSENKIIQGKGVVRWIAPHGINNSLPGFGIEFIHHVTRNDDRATK